MKIVALSDSHGSYTKLEQIIEKENPDSFIFCGDGIKDVLAFCEKHPEMYCHIVSGNCDRIDNFPLFKSVILGGKAFYITHGHMECVKSGYMTLAMRALSMESEIVVFGHTHCPICEDYQGMNIINPGSCSLGSYGLIVINEEDGSVLCELKMYK